MIPSKKRAEIMVEMGVSNDFLNELEASNKDVANKESEAREFKETDEVDVEERGTTDEVVETSDDGVDETTVDESVEVEESVDNLPAGGELDIQALLFGAAKQFEEVFSGISEVKEAVVEMATALEVLSKSQRELEDNFANDQKARSEEVVTQTPAFSSMYSGIVKSIIGNSDVVLDKDDEVDGPEEKEEKASTGFGSFIDGFVEKSHMAQGD